MVGIFIPHFFSRSLFSTVNIRSSLHEIICRIKNTENYLPDIDLTSEAGGHNVLILGTLEGYSTPFFFFFFPPFFFQFFLFSFYTDELTSSFKARRISSRRSPFEKWANCTSGSSPISTPKKEASMLRTRFADHSSAALNPTETVCAQVSSRVNGRRMVVMMVVQLDERRHRRRLPHWLLGVMGGSCRS